MPATSLSRELPALVKNCLARGRRPISLPHCAICARYATENLPFETILAVIDALPRGEAERAAKKIERQLAAIPAGFRQQHVTLGDFEAILDAPSWPLIRSLVVDMSEQEIAQWFGDPRLADIEEITLLGFAYGGPDVKPEFIQQLVDAPALKSVRQLSLHSGDIDEAGRQAFWSSPFAARLETIAGFPYAGESIPEPLAARSITGLGFYQELPESPTTWPLLLPKITPHLKSFTLNGGFGGIPFVLAVLAAHRADIARLDQFQLSLYQPSREQQGQLDQLQLAKCTEYTPELELRGGTFIADCDHLNVANAEAVQGMSDSELTTDYARLIFEFAAADKLSRRLHALRLIIPPDVPVSKIKTLLKRYSGLRELTIVHPFTFADAQQLAPALQKLSLRKLQLILSLKTGYATTEYKQKLGDSYEAAISPEDILRLALLPEFAAIEQLTIPHQELEIGRSPHEIQHLVARSAAAAEAINSQAPQQPIEFLKLLRPSAEDLAGFKRSKLLARVHRLEVEHGLTDDAMAVLTGDRGLRHVHSLAFYDYAKDTSPAAFAQLVSSPHLTAVRDFRACGMNQTGVAALARSPLLPRLVALGTLDRDCTGTNLCRQPLPLLRRLDETMTGKAFDDARQSRKFLKVQPSTPLRAQLAKHIKDMYTLRDHRSTKEIIASLQSLKKLGDSFDTEAQVDRELRALLARAFHKKPVKRGTAFADLTAEQQQALQALQEFAADYWWCVGFLVHRPLASYGFDFHQETFKEFLIGKQTSQ